MKTRSIVLCWFLLLIPTIIIGISGARLLSTERDRWEQMERSTALERARAIAQTIRNTVEGIQREITDSLIAIPRESLDETLLKWEKEHPDIRAVFIWQPSLGLTYPSPGKHASPEQTLFVNRYRALFVGRTAWLPDDPKALDDKSDSIGTGEKAGGISAAESRKAQNRPVRIVSSRLRDRQSQQPRQSEPQFMHGWIPWFSDNRLHLLGWVQNNPLDVVYGAELETVILVSRLMEKFPRDESPGIVYGLLDDTGRMLHQLGRVDIRSGWAPALEVSLSPTLPHWRIAAYFDPSMASTRSGNAFLLVSGLLLATLVVTILMGGVMLTRQAYAQWHDAQQKSSFVSNVSHELKTPLTTIRMYAELLCEGMINDPGKKNHYLRVIVCEAERLTRLVNNVLGFSRLERGMMKYHLQDIEMGELVRSFLETNAMRIQEAGMSIDSKIPDHPIIVRTDRDALEHTFLNIVDNAIKYASDGRRMNVVVGVNDGICQVRFLDNGPGIPKAYRERIFNKFQRVDDSLTSGKAGTGLGLTIARQMMKGLGGNVAYEPLDQQGSCFVISVPLATRNSPIAV